MIPLGRHRGCTSFRFLLTILVVLVESSVLCLSAASQSPPSHRVSREARNAFPELDRLIDTNQLPQARAKLREQVAVGGENYKTLYYEALILFKEGQYSQSLKTLERAFAAQKYDPDLYFLAGLD